MSTLKGQCSACGVPLEVDVSEPFAGGELAAALCPACTDAQFLDGCGAILELRRQLEGARFALGKVTITGGAVAALADGSEHAATFLARHVRGDWGECGHCDDIHLTADERRRGWEATDDSGKINKSNLLNRRDRVMSAYMTVRHGHHGNLLHAEDVTKPPVARQGGVERQLRRARVPKNMANPRRGEDFKERFDAGHERIPARHESWILSTAFCVGRLHGRQFFNSIADELAKITGKATPSRVAFLL